MEKNKNTIEGKRHWQSWQLNCWPTWRSLFVKRKPATAKQQLIELLRKYGSVKIITLGSEERLAVSKGDALHLVRGDGDIDPVPLATKRKNGKAEK